MSISSNIDPQQQQLFEQQARHWWDPNGPFRPLHQMNPLRLNYIDQQVGGLAGKRLLDVGCGGGILTEAASRKGALVSGLDSAGKAIEIARLHAAEQGLDIHYEALDIAQWNASQKPAFDVITCLEMLEHVPYPQHIVASCAALLKPGGWLFFSTLNRSLRAYLLAIIGAEYVLRLLPRGTHEYGRFIRPAELLSWLRQTGDLLPQECLGIAYNPITGNFRFGRSLAVNYLLSCRRS